MTDSSTRVEDERRNFYREAGIVYLHIAPHSDKASTDVSIDSAATLDPIILRLLNFRSRISYNHPDNEEYFQSVAEIVALLHDEITSLRSGEHLPYARRKSVIISGSGLEFLSQEVYQPKDRLAITITFLDYPFATISVVGEVIRCDLQDSTRKKYRTVIGFPMIKETKRDIIIKYVNYLQRKKHAKEKKGNS